MKYPSNFLKSNLIHSDRLRRIVPARLKALLKHKVPFAEYRVEQLRREAELRFGGPIPIESDYVSPHDATLGIFIDNSYTYAFNVAACIELGVRFKVIDLTASDWLRRVVNSGCDAFLATPATLLGVWHRMYEERLWVVSHDLGKRLCPTFEELYLWESKRRMRDWLVAHDVPHPETSVFFDRGEAMEFCKSTEYPVVAKNNSGGASKGVFVLRSRREAERLVGRAFGKGILAQSVDAREREWGSLLFQEYVPHEFEWRIVRIGDDFMCRRKVRVGDHASGSKDIGWARPVPGLLDFAQRVTDIVGFRSMALDVFENPTAKNGDAFLVNELQAIFGVIVKEDNINEYMGRWKRRAGNGTWLFEPGFFYQNACANLRVQMLLTDLVAIGTNQI